MAFWSMGKFSIPVDDDVDVLFIVAPVAVVLKLPPPLSAVPKRHAGNGGMQINMTLKQI
jgi:hypothetical protein